MSVDWRGDELLERIAAAAQRGMARALDDGVQAAQAQSRVRTGRYRDGWEATAPELSGTTVHGEIINEATNTSGQFYALYVSAGTSRMDGDFAHAAALDTAAVHLVEYIADEVGL